MSIARITKKDPKLRGYIRGLRAAGEYLDMSRNTFIKFMKDHDITPRRWRAQSYFKISTLDRAMNPNGNPVDPFFSEPN